MLCPACEIEMLVLEMLDVEIDYCHKCGGIWLDEGELELLIGDKSESSQVYKVLSDKNNSGKKGEKKCPVCRKRMNQVVIPIGKGLEIDKCQSAHGIWFDKGELQEIATHSHAGPVSDFLKNIFT